MPEISSQMKNDNWALFVLARSNNPEVKIPYTSELVANLIMSVRIAETTEYDETLEKCKYWADKALQILSDNSKGGDFGKRDWGEAYIKCQAALQEVGVMIYDPKGRWATVQTGSFRYPVQAPVKQDVK